MLQSQMMLREVSIKLFEQHLAQAIDALNSAQAIKKSTRNDFLIEWRLTTSCILYSFFALESFVNFLGHEYFYNENSSYYILPTDRKYSLKKLLASWERLPFLENLKIFLDEILSESIPPDIDNRLTELNKLRNWLVHGKPYTVTMLYEFVQVDESTVKSIIHDSEESVDFTKVFPHTKFKSPGSLDRNDALTAIKIVIQLVIFIVSKIRWFHTTISIFHNGKEEIRITSDSTVDSILKYITLD